MSDVEGQRKRGHSNLEELEQEGSNRPPWMLTKTELKLLGIAGVRAIDLTSGFTELNFPFL